MNQIFIIGNLTRDPESRTVNDQTVCNFTVAVSRRFNREQTDFIPVVAWRNLADNCFKFLSKGKSVAVRGELQIRTYEKNGNKFSVAEIIADEVKFLQNSNARDNGSVDNDFDPSDEDIPF